MLGFDWSKKILDGIFCEHTKSTLQGKETNQYGDKIQFENKIYFLSNKAISFLKNTEIELSADTFNQEYILETKEGFVLEDGMQFYVTINGSIYQLSYSIDSESLADKARTSIKFCMGNLNLIEDDIVRATYGKFHSKYANEPITIYGTIDRSRKITSCKMAGKSKYGVTVSIHADPAIQIYIGLFNEVPTDLLNSNYIEPSEFSEYQRVKLSQKSPFNKYQFILKSYTNPETGIAEIFNQEMIVFPEARGYNPETQQYEGWGTIKGFGLFYGPLDREKEKDTPFLWGTITSAAGGPVEIGADQVPVIRTDGLTISLQ